MQQGSVVTGVKHRLAFNLWPLCIIGLVVLSAYCAGLGASPSVWIFAGAALLLLVTNGATVVHENDTQTFIPVPEEVDDTQSLTGVHAGLAVLDTPVFVLNGQANVLFQNGAAEQIFGVATIGDHVSARLRAPALLELVNETIATGKPAQIEHVEKLPIERDYIVRVAPSAAGDDQKDAVYILTFREITDLRRIDRMRSDFVANASHELRTPLASLRGFIETLLGPAKKDEVARERFLNIMLEQATRMSRLVDDLMSLSRLELRANIAPEKTVELASVLSHVHDTLMPLANDLDVTVNLHLPDQAVSVLGDRDELVQVFQNLLENACKYGQEGKEVDVWLRGDAGKPVEVSIIDKGPGIPPEHVPRLTERFYRVSITDSRSKKGTGLGLAIVKHILTRHKARLIVRSQLGEGTDFTVRF